MNCISLRMRVFLRLGELDSAIEQSLQIKVDLQFSDVKI